MPLRFVNPNFHVILVHYPLGVFVLGVFLELFGFLWSRSSVRTAARWMILLGALASIPAATSGLYALADVRASQGIDDARYHMLRMHVIFMGCGSILAVLCAVVGLAASDRLRRQLYAPLLLGVVAAWGLMVCGAWHGGETIYQQGTSVAIIKLEDGKTALGELPAEKDHSIIPRKDRNDDDNYDDIVNYYGGGVLQIHLIVAGFALAFAMGALGLSYRKGHAAAVVTRPGYGQSQSQAQSLTEQAAIARSLNPDSAVTARSATAPAARFWLLASLLILLTAGLGYWTQTGSSVLAKDSFHDFTDKLHTERIWPPSRHMAHLVLAGALLVIGLLMAIFAGAAPRKRLITSIFGLLLVLVIAAQIWIGVLMTFDKNEGSVFGFTPPKPQTEKKHHGRHHTTESPETTPAATEPASVQTPATVPATTLPTPPTTEPKPAPNIFDIPAPPESPKPDAPKPDAPKPDASKPDTPKPDAPKPDAPKPDEAKPDASKI